MKENFIQAIFAVAIGTFAAYFQMLAIPIAVLIVAMAIDYATGMSNAWCKKTCNSRTGIVGILKKVGYFGLVAVGMVLDYLIKSALVNVGVEIHASYCICIMIIIWLIINELISILENLDKLGVPVPGFVSKLILRLKNTLDEKTEE